MGRFLCAGCTRYRVDVGLYSFVVYLVNSIALCLRACMRVHLTRNLDTRMSKDRRTDLVLDSSVLHVLACRMSESVESKLQIETVTFIGRDPLPPAESLLHPVEVS